MPSSPHESPPDERRWTLTRSHPMTTSLDGPRLALGESVAVVPLSQLEEARAESERRRKRANAEYAKVHAERERAERAEAELEEARRRAKVWATRHTDVLSEDDRYLIGCEHGAEQSEAALQQVRQERDEARVRLAVFHEIADETIRGGYDGSWFRAALSKRLGDLGPEYEIETFVRALQRSDELERQLALTENELRSRTPSSLPDLQKEESRNEC